MISPYYARGAKRVNPEKSADAEIQTRFSQALDGIPIDYEPHVTFKIRVPHAIGLIRTGDKIQYANLILESA